MARSARRAYRRPTALRVTKSLFVVLLVVLLFAMRWWNQPSEPSPVSMAEGVYRVDRVVDGDTLLLANRARVRLIGADTPETVKPDHPVEPWGPEASSFTRQFIADGEVRLQFDRERLDRYNRWLAYVWVGDRMLNEELIRAGLATAETGFHYSSAMKTRFRRAQKEAQTARRAIWSNQRADGVNSTSAP